MCCGNCNCVGNGEPARPENGAGPTVENEIDLLAEKFGEANQDGIYGAVVIE